MQTDYSQSGKKRFSHYVELTLMVIVFALLMQVGLRKHDGRQPANSNAVKSTYHTGVTEVPGHR